jgi:hypothetical protein
MVAAIKIGAGRLLFHQPRHFSRSQPVRGWKRSNHYATAMCVRFVTSPIAFSSEVATGSREENALKQKDLESGSDSIRTWL